MENMELCKDTPEVTVLRHQLRDAQQSGNLGRVRALVAEHPELEFADDVNLLAILAVCYCILQRREDAEMLISDLYPDDLSDAGALADFGLLLFMLGREEMAESILKRACALPDAGYEAFARLGTFYMANERLMEAGNNFERALHMNPHRAEVVSNLGGIRFRLGFHEEALELYDRALMLNPYLVQTREMRQRTLQALDRADEIIDEAQEALDKDPDNPDRHFALGMAQLQGDYFEQAEATLDAAVTRFPDRDDLKKSLVQICFDRQQFW